MRFSAFAILLLAGHCLADEPAKQPPAPAGDSASAAPDKWRKLFDGKTLQNWAATEFGGEGEVLVKEGQLVLEAGQPMTGATWKGGDLPKSNYEVRLEARKLEGSDFFLALTFPVQESHCSLVLGGWGGGVVGLSSINGFDASENETTVYESFTKEQWYKVRVRVTDGAVQAWLDDERIVNVPTKDNRFSLRIEVDANRPLGMATYMTVGAYRNIEIRNLTAAEAAAPVESK
jgi:hypothetical protein